MTSIFVTSVFTTDDFIKSFVILLFLLMWQVLITPQCHGYTSPVQNSSLFCVTDFESTFCVTVATLGCHTVCFDMSFPAHHMARWKRLLHLSLVSIHFVVAPHTRFSHILSSSLWILQWFFVPQKVFHKWISFCVCLGVSLCLVNSKLKNKLLGVDLVERQVTLDHQSFWCRVSLVLGDWMSQGLLAICPMLYAAYGECRWIKYSRRRFALVNYELTLNLL
jgi:hypothetical protein